MYIPFSDVGIWVSSPRISQGISGERRNIVENVGIFPWNLWDFVFTFPVQPIHWIYVTWKITAYFRGANHLKMWAMTRCQVEILTSQIFSIFDQLTCWSFTKLYHYINTYGGVLLDRGHTPSYHPNFNGIFYFKKHPEIGVYSPTLGTLHMFDGAVQTLVSVKAPQLGFGILNHRSPLRNGQMLTPRCLFSKYELFNSPKMGFTRNSMVVVIQADGGFLWTSLIL